MNQLRRYTALVGAVLFVLAAACTTKEQGIAVTGVTLSPSTLTLGVGESKTLTAEVQPSDATNKTISWSTDDPSMNVIALSGNTVKGIAEGSATVTVTTADGNRTATCKVTVSKEGSSENPNPGTEDEVPVAGVSVSPASLSLTVGDEASLSAAYTPANATLKGQWAWSVDNPSVASVQYAGGNATIKALAAGSATVTASLDGKSATASITVSAVAVQVPDGTVDMGLPSGIFWCAENLGTDADHPDGVGYKWEDNGQANKYNKTDGLTLLEAEDDRATQALGENYRTPTLGDFAELISNCTQEGTKQGELEGVLFTSKKNGHTLFIPKATLWTATLCPYKANYYSTEYHYDAPWVIRFVKKDDQYLLDYWSYGRNNYYRIRPVYAKRPVIATGVSVSKDKVEIGRGETVKLTASVQPSSANQQVLWFMDEYSKVTTTATVNCYTGEVSLTEFGNTVRYAYAVEGVNGLTAETFIYPKYPSTQPEAVDLGLPSGTKWASCDLGSYAPEEPGFYYAWGETDQKFGYFANSTKWIHYNEGSPSFEKYDQNNRILELEDDAAAVHLGGGWQIPSREQVQELINKTTMVETTLNGVKGRLVTGPNLNTIFLPYGGYINSGDNAITASGKEFHYQINEIEDYSSPTRSYCFINGEIRIDPQTYRYFGCCIRPVLPKQ